MRLLPPNRAHGWAPFVWLVYFWFFYFYAVFDRVGWKEWHGPKLSFEAISKLGASNRVEAARIARTKGWL